MGFAVLLLVRLLSIGFDLTTYYDGDELVVKHGTSTRESILGNYSQAAVASDGAGSICATIGK